MEPGLFCDIGQSVIIVIIIIVSTFIAQISSEPQYYCAWQQPQPEQGCFQFPAKNSNIFGRSSVWRLAKFRDPLLVISRNLAFFVHYYEPQHKWVIIGHTVIIGVSLFFIHIVIPVH